MKLKPNLRVRWEKSSITIQIQIASTGLDDLRPKKPGNFRYSKITLIQFG